ncbi:two-component regulator propeller domain-containing protein [Prevotella sp. 10(H)]|uniref:two-component regulator propeller domain-containing protein n=1 Tax=Prevotella sp. 10(H) TaxID=1158294 RepID=UPI0004A73FE4|nr:two-component regulator propeller domain-containing protein [Prevotella sp. 10(H)]
MQKCFFHILFVLLFSSSLWCQNRNYQTFKNIIPNSEASTVHCFAQDTQGLIWIGTNKGLFSYDGYSTQQHFTFGDSTNTLIYSILIYDSSYLLLGTDNGLLIYNYQTDQYEQFPADFPPDIRALAVHDNDLWIGSIRGLYRYSLQKKQIEQINRGLPHNTIYSLLQASDNNLYIGTYNGFCRYISETGKFEIINLPSDTRRNNQFINSLLEDNNNNIWIGTEGALFKYSLKDKSIEDIPHFHNNSIKSLALDEDNNLILATDNGLYTYNNSNKGIQHYVHDSRNSKSLSNNIIWGAFADKEKNIWLGTDYGISLSCNNRTFQSVPISEITGIGDGNRFHSIFKDSRGNFWFGGTNGLIVSPSPTNNTDATIWYRMGDKKYPISHNRIRNIYEDKDHNLWVATDGSINRYDYQKKQFIHYTIIDSTQTLNSNWAYYIFEDDKKQLWIATCLGGIFVVNKENLLKSSGNYIADKNYSTLNGLSGDFVNQIIPDPHGNVWVLLYNNGIDKINTATGKIEKFPIEHGTNNENPNYIILDNEGFLWAGYRGGLVRINTKDNSSEFIKFATFSNSEILSLNEIDENIWISTTEGIWVLDKKTFDVKRLNVPNQSYTCSYYDKSTNKIYMGGVDEFTLLSPDIQHDKPDDATLVFTALYVNDNLYDTSQDKGNSIRYLDEIQLNYKQNNLTFEFSDLTYSEEETSKFVYKLEELDKDWNILNQDLNRISYTNLEYGKYRLIVSKLDSSGKPSAISRTLVINISPPWYYTIWAKCLYGVLVLALIVWIINFFRVRHNLRIERIEKEKTVELTNLKIDFFTNVSHEFKTPLSLIIAPVSKLLLEIKDPQKKQQLENVQKNALQLNSLIRQILEFSRTDSTTNASLLLSRVEFVEFARSLFSIYEEGFKDKKLNFSFLTDHEKIYISIDVLKIESVLNNLLSNACKYTGEGGKIELRLNYSKDDNTLNIILSDEGIGIPAKEIPYIFERYYQTSKTTGYKEGTGIGLYLVKTYTEQHGGQIYIDSEENKGTTITISLPVKDEAENNSVQDEQEEYTVNKNSPLILVVDDNPEIADFISQTLTPKYRCKVAHNGKMALELVKMHNPDLIVADVMMPVMDGLEMSRRIRKSLPTSTIPIILLTAKDDKSTEMESINLNVDAFISKPFNPELLLSRISQLLKSKQQIEDKLRIETIATPQAIEATSPDEKFLSEIIGIIENKISDPDLNVNALSTISGIGSKQIYRKIKQLTGLSPVEYIRSIRLKKAAMLLSQKKFTVAEVMYMVGFSNHSYFSKCFQTEFGKTPRQFMDGE